MTFDPTKKFDPQTVPTPPTAPQPPQAAPQGVPGQPVPGYPPGYQQPGPYGFYGYPPGPFAGYGAAMPMPYPMQPGVMPPGYPMPAPPPPVEQPPQVEAPVEAKVEEQAPAAELPPSVTEVAPDKSPEEPTTEEAAKEFDVLTPAPLGGQTSISMDEMLTFKDLDLGHPSVAGANVSVSWRGEMGTDELRQAFINHGIDKKFWPIDPGPTQALKRALMEKYAKTSTYRVDPIGRGQGWGVSVKDAAKLAQYLAAGDDEALRKEAEHAYTTFLTVAISKEGGVLDLVFSPPDHADAADVRERFKRHQHTVVFAEDVSVLFSNKILPAAGVTGRGQDQIWYCPKGKGLDLLRTVREALLSVSTLDKDGTLQRGGKVRLTAQVLTRSFIETIMDSLISDADRMLGKIDAEIDNLGDKALTNRITEINDMKKVLADHAKLLGASVECVTERLTSVERKVAAARAKVWQEQVNKLQAQAGGPLS